MHRRGEVSFRRVTTFNMDEYVGKHFYRVTFFHVAYIASAAGCQNKLLINVNWKKVFNFAGSDIIITFVFA